MNKATPLNTGFKYGLLSAIISILFTVILYVIKPSLIFSWWAFLPTIILIILMVLAGLEVKRAAYNELSFLEALKTTFTVFFISALLSIVFQYVMMNFIDPSLVDIQNEFIEESTISMMERFGAPEDSIEDALNRLEEQDNSPNLKNTFFNLISMSVFGLFLACIVSLIIKRKRKASYG